MNNNDMPSSCRADENERWLLSAASNGYPKAIEGLDFSTPFYQELARVIRNAGLSGTPDDRMMVVNALTSHPQKDDLLPLFNGLADDAKSPNEAIIKNCREAVDKAAEFRLAWNVLEKGQQSIRDGNADNFLDNLPALLRTIESRRARTPSLNLASCLVSSAALDSMILPKRKRLLDRWLCEGDLGYVFAPRGVGKTWFVLALLAAISKGMELGNWNIGEAKAKALYVDGEMPLELIQTRFRSLEITEGDVNILQHELLFEKLETSLNIGLESHRRAITELCVEKKIEVMVLDNLSALASGVVENRGEDYEPIAQWLLELRRRKITVIVVHHAGRNGLMRGHSKREDACSWILELRDAKGDGERGAKFISHFAKPSRNTAEPLPDLLWHFVTEDDGILSIGCELAQTTEYEAFIQHVLDGVEQQSEIAELMNKPKGTISKWAKKAAGERRIRREGGKLKPPSGQDES